MFADLFEIDWAALSHACGSAEDVPQILLGFVSDDSGERERALDTFYARVHHQGDVYESTVACLPFLFEVALAPGLPDRASVIWLIGSIAVPLGAPDDPDDPEETAWRAPFVAAQAFVRDRAEDFAGLLEDGDAQVRAAAASMVARYLEPHRVVDLLRRCFETEADPELLLILLTAAANAAVREPRLADGVAEWMTGIVAGSADVDARLAALVQLARSAPERTVDDLVTSAIGMLQDISGSYDPQKASATGRASVPARTISMRLLFAPQHVGPPRNTWSAELRRVVTDTFAERVADRTAAVANRLADSDPHRIVEALETASDLMRGWRGSYDQVVRRVGDKLAAPDFFVRFMAARTLEEKYDLALPAADALAELVAATDPDAWTDVERMVRSPYRSAVLVLARLGDPRVIPALAAALDDSGDRALPLAESLGRFRGRAGRVYPDLRAGLATLADTMQADPGPGPKVLLAAARTLRAAGTAPELNRIVAAATRLGTRWVAGDALAALEALGPAGGDVAPAVRALSEHDDLLVALLALRVCWSVDTDPEFVLARLQPRLEGATPADAARIARVAASLGPYGAPLEPLIRPLMQSPDLWARTYSAIALAHATGDAEPVIPVLMAAWQEDSFTRLEIA